MAPPSVAPFHDKRVRSFLCRDGLWSELEGLARELECSVDYVVHEALKSYVRKRCGRAVVPPPPTRPLPPLPPPVPPPPRAPPAVALTFAGAARSVDASGFVIGRSKRGGLTIPDPNVSRQHALLEQQDGRWYVVDLGSMNGTLLNGQRVARAAIADGDVIGICEHEVKVGLARRP